MTRSERLGLEPGSLRSFHRTDEAASRDETQHSIAISLKRIPDAMEKDGGKSHFERIFG